MSNAFSARHEAANRLAEEAKRKKKRAGIADTKGSGAMAGAMYGGKAGATYGTGFGPWGTAIGGIVGAMGGAIAGGLADDAITGDEGEGQDASRATGGDGSRLAGVVGKMAAEDDGWKKMAMSFKGTSSMGFGE